MEQTARRTHRRFSIKKEFFIDVQDLPYSISQGGLMVVVRERLEQKGAVSFQNAYGVGVDDFIEILTLDLRSTFALLDGIHYVQKKVTCIGSCVSPVLCGICLAKCDQVILLDIDVLPVFKVFRYVDEYLVILNTTVGLTVDDVLQDVLTLFKRNCDGLKLTHQRQDD